MAESESESFVVLVAVALELGDAFVERVRAVRPGAELVSMPYATSIPSGEARSAEHGHGDVDLNAAQLSDAARDAWKRADVAIVLDVPDDLASLAPNLRWIQCAAAGVDKFDLASFSRAGIRLSNASGLGAASISEFVIGRILQVCKNLPTFDDQQRRHEWTVHFGTELTGRTIGIVGFGSIGRQVARRAQAFDMRVVASRASASTGDHDPDADAMFSSADLDLMLSECDVVVACLPSTPATIDLFDAARFSAMRRGAIFCNVGRGVQVVEPDLIEALESGHVRAGILDVTRVEPLPANDRLWDAPNLLLSPHSSVSLDRYAANLEVLVVDNLRRFLEGDRLINEVDLTGD